MTSCNRFEREGLLQRERGDALDEHYQSCPDCRAARDLYDRLHDELVSAGSGYQPPADWQARVRAAIAQRRERRRWWWPKLLVPAGIAAAGAAAMLVVLVRHPEPESVAALRVEIEAAGEVIRRGPIAQVGDWLHLQATAAGAEHAELRVYRHDAELVMRCSTQPPCVRDGDLLEARLRLEALGSYQALLLVSELPLPPPTAGLDRDLGAALETGAHVHLGDEVRVR